MRFLPQIKIGVSLRAHPLPYLKHIEQATLSLTHLHLSKTDDNNLSRRRRREKSFESLAKTGLPVWMLGFGVAALEADMDRLVTLLFHQGVLDEQFTQLRQLQDESSPNFVSEVISIYFQESEKHLDSIRALLLGDRECTDYSKMGIHINQLMGSSSSIGAKRMTTVCVAFRSASEHASWTGCVRFLGVLEHEYCYLKNKLHEFLQMEQQRAIAAGVRYHPLLEA